MKLNHQGLKNRVFWEKAGILLPGTDCETIVKNTVEHPVWIHFGAGNIFRGFIAKLQQSLLEQGLTQAGIVAAESFDLQVIRQIYRPFDNLSLLVGLRADGTTQCEVINSIGLSLCASADAPDDMAALKQLFLSPTLQMVSFTITEKGYALQNLEGAWLAVVQEDFVKGPENCRHVMSLICALLWNRFCFGAKTPLALVSMDNCSRNGEKLRSAVLTVAEQWCRKGFVSEAFVRWISNERQVSFPWTMIDKITPRPAETVAAMLKHLGIEGMEPVVTEKNTFIAPFVNGEIPQYLVIEDSFPNGRPPLERAGVYMTDRETVGKTERMKVTTCLNPLHTALAVFGCLLGFKTIAEEMAYPPLKQLVEGIGIQEGLKVVTDPLIISPENFLREVLEERFPNPFIPDTPQRIATDTSQKIPVRFGETIKSYSLRSDLDMAQLTFIPLAIAGWLRYLLGIDDKGAPFRCSSDPLLETLQAQLSHVIFGTPQSVKGQLDRILSNEILFGTDLTKTPLAAKIEGMLCEMLEGPGAVGKTLEKYGCPGEEQKGTKRLCSK